MDIEKGGCMFLKKRGISRRGNEKTRGGGLILLSALWINAKFNKLMPGNYFTSCLIKKYVFEKGASINDVHTEGRSRGS